MAINSPITRQLIATSRVGKAKKKEESVDITYRFHNYRSVPSRHVTSLDSLRGIGVIIVILYHMGYEHFSNAWFEISLFFAMSGFVITKTTVESYERNHHFDVLKFWSKRVSRLLPALLLMLVVVVLSQKLPFRRNDGVQFQREANDLFYAAVFLTNYNLVYNQPDDYFDEFSPPSITRHLWTLSIEEQYYIIWPLVVWCLTKIFGADIASNHSNAERCYNHSNSVKRFLQTIFLMDVCIMIFSYYSSLWSIENTGMTAAYYSTWCRMGDIAAGGSAYSFARLAPMISSRWYREVKNPNIQLLSTGERVFLEAMVALLLLTVICVPMIRRPTDELLELYFHKLRLVISMLSLVPVFHSIQESEPLPKWAIASKIFRLRFLSFLGTFSYGVYLVHWPVIVLFGASRKDRARSNDGNMVTNALLFILTILMGYISFVYYEVPLMKIARASTPWKTVIAGLLAVLMTVAVILVTTMNLPPIVAFENEHTLEDKPVDERYTPVFFHDMATDGWSSIFRKNVLDGKTRHSGQDFNMNDFEEIRKYYPKETKGAKASIIITCDMNDSPCNHPDLWINNTYWIWLDSPLICGPIKNRTKITLRTCDSTVTVREHTFRFEPQAVPTLDPTTSEFAEVVLLTLFVSIDDLVDYTMNRRSVFNAKKRYQELLHMSELQKRTICKQIRLTVLGESIAEKIGGFWKDYIDYDMPASNISNASLCPEVTNLAFAAHSSLAHYLCLSTDEVHSHQFCSQPSLVSQTVLTSCLDTKPDAVVIHDQYWAFKRQSANPNQIVLPSLFDKILAFNMMISDALQNEVSSIYYLTKSPLPGVLGVSLDPGYTTELELFQQMADTLACSKRNDEGHGIRVVLIDWARLICPNISDLGTVCKTSVHGFKQILPDGVHPVGDSGEWLSRQILAIIMADMAMLLSDRVSWDEAIAIPVNRHLLQLAPPDNQPRLQDLFTAHTLCPYNNISQLKIHVDSIL